MSPDLLQRLATQRAACKQWCALLATAVLLAGAIAKLPLSSLLWAAAPIFLLGVTEASYAAQERRLGDAEMGRRGEKAEGGWLRPEPAGRSFVRTGLAAMSLAVWPFYLGLFAMVGFGAVSMNSAGKPAPVLARAGGCGSGGCGGGAGGCGAGGGCGAAASSNANQPQPAGVAAYPQQQMSRPVTMPTGPRPAFVPLSAVQPQRPANVNPAQPGTVTLPVQKPAAPAASPVAAPAPGSATPVSGQAAPAPVTPPPAVATPQAPSKNL